MKDNDLLAENTVAVAGGEIEIRRHELSSSKSVSFEVSTYYDENEPILVTMSAHQCELFINSLQTRLEEIR